MINLSEIVAQFLDEQNLGDAEYAKAYRFANRAIKEIGWDVTGEVKTVEVVADDNKMIILPTDLLRVLDFGIADGKGGIASYSKVKTMKYDTDVANYQNLLELQDLDNPNLWGNTPYGYYGNFSNELPLGVGSYNTIGEYMVSSNNQSIMVDPKSNYSHFLLQYLATTQCTDEANEFIAPAVVAYIKWKFFQVAGKYSIRDIEYYKSEYYREKRNAKNRVKALTTQQMNELARVSVKMGIKS